LVFDTGPKLNVVVPFLATRGIHKIDTIIISHGDSDHIGGMESILNQLKVNNILTSDQNKVQNNLLENNQNQSIKNEPCVQGQKWEWDGIQFEMMHPNTLENNASNNPYIQGIKNLKKIITLVF
jgi:competence protein ComEC